MHALYCAAARRAKQRASEMDTQTRPACGNLTFKSGGSKVSIRPEGATATSQQTGTSSADNRACTVKLVAIRVHMQSTVDI